MDETHFYDVISAAPKIQPNNTQHYAEYAQQGDENYMKKHSKRTLLASTIVAALVGPMTSCGSDSNAPAGAVVNIALVLPYSDDFASRGKAYENAVTMAVEDLKAGGFSEATGKNFKFTLISSGNGAGEVTSELQKAFDANKNPDGTVNFAAVISSTGTAQIGSTQIAGENQIPHFETSSGAHHNEFVDAGVSDDERSFMFSTRALCAPEAEYTADFIAAKFPGKKVALFRGNQTHDIMHTNTIRARLKEIGWTGTILESNDAVAADAVFGENQGDYILDYDKGVFDEEIGSVVTAETPDVIFFHLRGDNHNLRFLQDANRAGFQGAIVTCGMARKGAILDPEQNGNISDFLEDRLNFVMRAPIPSDDLTAFNARYASQFTNFTVDEFTPSSYDAMMLIGLALVQANPDTSGTTIREGILSVASGGTKHTFSDIKAAIADIAKGVDVDYDGPSGTLDISDTHIVPGSYYIDVAKKKADGSGLEYKELIDPARETIIGN